MQRAQQTFHAAMMAQPLRSVLRCALRADPGRPFLTEPPHTAADWPAAKTLALRLFWFKLTGTSGFMTLFFIAYLHLLRHPAYPVMIIPVTALDRLVPFEPFALPFYLSLWFYVSLPPVLMDSRSEIARYGLWIGAMCLTGLSIFYFWPSAIPRTDIDWSVHPGIAFLKSIDAAGNACPSMHVATAVFSAFWLDRGLLRLRPAGPLRILSALWCAAIVFSTLATKQHMALDVLAGVALALVFYHGGASTLGGRRGMTGPKVPVREH